MTAPSDEVTFDPFAAQHGIRIAPVPADQVRGAVELLFEDVASQSRPDQIQSLLALLEASPQQTAGLLGAWHQQQLIGVTFLQIQAGRVASLMPPKSSGHDSTPDSHTPQKIAELLIVAALQFAQARQCTMVQCLLETDAGHAAQWLFDAGFEHAADLLYLVSLSGVFPTSRPATQLQFIPVDDPRSERLASIVERTYVGTRDCPALNAVRSTADVLAGYRQVGSSPIELRDPGHDSAGHDSAGHDSAGHDSAELWRIVQQAGIDVGCLLMADHSENRCWELVYMGVVPEARGQGLGIEIARFAQWLARQDGIERLVLAADAENAPAIDLYASAGFVAWDRRSVLLKIFAQA